MPSIVKNVSVYTDGGSRGNPGPAASAFVIIDEKNNTIAAIANYLGTATNNVAEYTALLNALIKCTEIKAENVNVFTDSELMAKQINGQYRVKNENLIPIYQQCKTLLAKFKSHKVTHVYRHKNTQADDLVNLALDARKNIDRSPAKQKSAPKQKPLKLAVLISGGGTTLLNILDSIEKSELNASVELVISSKPDVKGVHRAKDANLNVEIITKKQHPAPDDFSSAINAALEKANVDLVLLAGFLCLWNIPDKFNSRVMNIHPALLPSFGGKGMWGHHVHQAVLDKGCKVSGCTVHFATNEYDQGPIIVQRCCHVKEDDTPDTLAARVFQQECLAYPTAIRLFADGKLKIEGTKVKIID